MGNIRSSCHVPLVVICRTFYRYARSYLAPVVQKVDNVIHRINHYPLDSAIGFAMTYPLVSDLSGG